ncbi:MAG: class I SAM-dependent methyltransferase [Pseudomonadota bacterium]|nr:class I SAM-dependent methyltransferase [Pseudomonadota bacterium]
MTTTVCRVCNSAYLTTLGPLPNVRHFAGRDHGNTLRGGMLYRCEECRFVFRDPPLKQAEYDELYRRGSGSVWDAQVQREDFRLVRQLLTTNCYGDDVLDVGCYSGTLLSSLPSKYRLYGIELNQAAAGAAAQRGVQIVASAVNEMALVDQRFDTIISCDVIEHLLNPLDFLQQLRSRLKPGGRIVITTGNADAWLWRLCGSRFWYCYFPEHISFVGSRWLQLMPQTIGLKVEQLMPFNYRFQQQYCNRSLPILAAALVYAAAPNAYRSIRHAIRGHQSREFSPPGCGASKDHLLCVMAAT